MRMYKALALLALVCLDVALWVIATTPPVSGFEISLYDAYPWYFWLLIWTSIACGISILIHHAFSTDQRSRWWVAGLMIVISTNVVVLLLPAFRGYFISDLADEVSHLGMIKQVLLEGRATNNVYPISHILAGEVCDVTGLDARMVMKIIPVFFYLLYMIGLYLLARSVVEKLGTRLLVMALGSVLLFLYFEYMFMPTQFLLCLVPLTLMLLAKKRTTKDRLAYTVLLIVMLILMPFTHPFGSLCVVATLLVAVIATLTSRFLSRKHKRENEHGAFPAGAVVLPASILFVTFSLWFYHSSLFGTAVSQAWQSIVSGYGQSEARMIAEKGQQGGVTPIVFLKLLINTNGHDLIFMLLSLLAILLVLRQWRKSRNAPTADHVFLALLFMFFTLFYAATLLGTFADVGQTRTMCWALMASTLLSGIVLYEWAIRLNSARLRLCVSLLTLAILASAVIGLLSVFPSPHIGVPNGQATEMNWNSMEWFLARKTSDETLYLASEFPRRAPEAIYGWESPKRADAGAFSRIPPGFGYRDNETLAYAFDSDRYIVITEFDRAYFIDLWKNVTDMATPDDFNKLDTDHAVNRIYDNGDTEILRVSVSSG